MGHRELRRVPLNFNAPLNKVWEGYICPYRPPKRCIDCDGSGYNKETKQIADDFYSYSSSSGKGWCNEITQDEVEVLVKEDRLWNFTRRPINEEQREVIRKLKEEKGHGYWLPFYNGYMPTAKEVNEWNEQGIGHDGINRMYLIRARAKRLGVYGHCQQCEGEGEIYLNEKFKKLWNEWEPEELPKGEGYQLWETTSEGSPVSPVFKTAEALAEWCAENATIFASEKTTYENWLNMFKKDEVEDGSLMIAKKGYVGSVANAKD